MVEAYGLINQKLQHALSVHDSYERTIRTLKASKQIFLLSLRRIFFLFHDDDYMHFILG